MVIGGASEAGVGDDSPARTTIPAGTAGCRQPEFVTGPGVKGGGGRGKIVEGGKTVPGGWLGDGSEMGESRSGCSSCCARLAGCGAPCCGTGRPLAAK